MYARRTEEGENTFTQPPLPLHWVRLLALKLYNVCLLYGRFDQRATLWLDMMDVSQHVHPV